ncbi:hypothetical protein WDJ51_09985 [Rathayibacter sp. YIM 133350]|uniref:hypothetical protein n=1 Tax=Rathayibacter sp. YIM 133350 TaxID=3131992 RepID=UPI00307F7508
MAMLAAIMLAVLAGVLPAASLAAPSSIASSHSEETARSTRAAKAAAVRVGWLLASASKESAAAERSLTASAGQGYRQDVRDSLELAILDVDARIGDARRALADTRLGLPSLEALGASQRQLGVAVSALRDDIAKRQRIRALVNALSTPDLLARVQADAGIGNGAPASASAGGIDHEEYVWTSGGQAELDARHGSVDMTAGYGLPSLAEHWSTGGRDFPRWAGARVHITGNGLDGIYLVEGVVAYLNQHTDSPAMIPRGFDLVYQTCVSGDSTRMPYVALTRIG